jgi:hypothetical protein
MCEDDRIKLLPDIEKALRGCFKNAACELPLIFESAVKNKVDTNELWRYINIWEGRWIRYFKSHVFDLIEEYTKQTINDIARKIILEEFDFNKEK